MLQIFFRTGVVSQLEAQRDERLTGVIISFQSQCRGYLARRKLQQRKLQDLAVRCIQRNVRKFMLVRDWPWWRLLVRVTPLLNVHRTEEELRAKTVSFHFFFKSCKCTVYIKRHKTMFAFADGKIMSTPAVVGMLR